MEPKILSIQIKIDFKQVKCEIITLIGAIITWNWQRFARHTVIDLNRFARVPHVVNKYRLWWTKYVIIFYRGH